MPLPAGPAEHGGQRGAQGGEAAISDPLEPLQGAVIGGILQCLQGIDVQLVMDLRRQLRADPRHGLKQVCRVQAAAQTLQLGPATTGDDLRDGGGNAPADPRQEL